MDNVIPAKQSVRECPESVIPAQAGIQKLIFISKLQYTIYYIRLTFFYCRTHWKAGIQFYNFPCKFYTGFRVKPGMTIAFVF